MKKWAWAWGSPTGLSARWHIAASLLVGVMAVAAGCAGRSGGGGGPGTGGGGGGSGLAGSDGGTPSDGSVTADHPIDAPGGGDGGGCLGADGGAKKAAGQHCACASDCASGYCVDGFCCNEACASGCRTCALTGSEGTCVSRVSGADPRHPSDC